MPKISVIVPVYNIEGYIDDCIHSILAQTEPDIEVIVVDDGSTDASGEKCDAWAGKDSRVQVVHQPNRGLRGALFTGLARATAPYTGFVDGDDWVEPAMFATLLAVTAEHEADIVECGYTETGGGQPDLCHASGHLRVMAGEDIHRQVLRPLLEEDGLPHGFIVWSRCNKLYRTGLLKAAAEGLDTTVSLGEDFTLTLSCLLRCHSTVVLPGACHYNYRRSATSMTRTYDERSVKRYDPFIREARALAEPHGYTCAALAQTRDRLLTMDLMGMAVSPAPIKKRSAVIRAITAAVTNPATMSESVQDKGLPARLMVWAARHGFTGPALLASDVYFRLKGQPV